MKIVNINFLRLLFDINTPIATTWYYAFTDTHFSLHMLNLLAGNLLRVLINLSVPLLVVFTLGNFYFKGS